MSEKAENKVNVTDALLGNKIVGKDGGVKKAFDKAAAKPAFKRERTAEQVENEWSSKMIEVNRVTKVTKGGRTLRFAAIVIVGNKKGMVGMGTGKAGEVSVAIQKAEQAAKKSVFGVKIVGTTIPHQQLGEHGASKVFLWPTKEGNGIIAGGATRAVLELAGYKDVTAKIHGSRNNGNVVRATINALNALRTKEEIAALRGKTAEQI